jgi:hypothetical protein
LQYIIKGGYCKNCGKVFYPEVPETIGNRHFGIHFLLYLAYLRYVMNLPENKIVTLLNDTYDADVSIGTVVDYQTLTGFSGSTGRSPVIRRLQSSLAMNTSV